MNTFVPQHVHLVGSIGLDSVPEVFRTLGRTLGRRLRRVPDGEVGGRRLWVSWQYPLFRANPFLAATDTARPRTGFLELRLGDGVRGEDVVFGELGYAREARASFWISSAPKNAASCRQDVRFQVCLPTPFAVVNSFCSNSGRARRSSRLTSRRWLAEIACYVRKFRTTNCAYNGTSAWRWCFGTARTIAAARSVETFRRTRSWRACSASVRRIPDRRRAGDPPLLRRFRGQAFHRAARRRQDGRVCQCFGQGRSRIRSPSSTCRFRRAHRRRLLQAVRRPAPRPEDRALPGRGSCQGRRRWHAQAHCSGEQACPAFRHRL